MVYSTYMMKNTLILVDSFETAYFLAISKYSINIYDIIITFENHKENLEKARVFSSINDFLLAKNNEESITLVWSIDLIEFRSLGEYKDLDLSLSSLPVFPQNLLYKIRNNKHFSNIKSILLESSFDEILIINPFNNNELYKLYLTIEFLNLSRDILYICNQISINKEDIIETLNNRIIYKTVYQYILNSFIKYSFNWFINENITLALKLITNNNNFNFNRELISSLILLKK